MIAIDHPQMILVVEVSVFAESHVPRAEDLGSDRDDELVWCLLVRFDLCLEGQEILGFSRDQNLEDRRRTDRGRVRIGPSDSLVQERITAWKP
jgi:hypothetical protein